MEPIQAVVDSVLRNPRYADALAVVKAARNGAVYGAKVRFPHALVMVFLFRSGSFWEKIRVVLKATRQHARNLATYAMIYKTSMLLLRAASPSGKEASSHTFLAGLVGGYVVFGRSMHSSVNQQIVIYVFARVVLALAKLAVREGSGISQEARTRITTNAWPVFASLSWAFVMWIFRWHPETIQPSLRSSMRYIYVNADRWDSFRNFLIYNT